MMRALRSRNIVPEHLIESRSHRLAIIRWVYLSSLLALTLWLLNFFFGSLVYLRADGLVVGDPAAVAAEFPATVRTLHVREGDHVVEGDIAASVSSQNVVESIARLSADIASRRTRLGELGAREKLVDALLTMAQNRQSVATTTRQEYETLLAKGFLSLDKRVAAIDSEYRSNQDLETLKADRRTINAEVAVILPVLAEAETARQNLQDIYDDGRLRAPVSGIVTRRVADVGTVVRAGDPVLEIASDRHYVLAYVPTGGLYSVDSGDEVEMTTGFSTTRGRVTRIEPLAAALPKEFQRAFVPTERQQVIRIDFSPGEKPPPVFSKVRVVSSRLKLGWFGNIAELVGPSAQAAP